MSSWLPLLAFVLLANPARAALIPPDPTPIPSALLTEARPRKARVRIRLESNPAIQYWVDRFSGWDKERFAQFMERGAVYQDLIEAELARQGIPSEFYYLAMIESGFVHDARSWASAAGIWQFTRPTARLYGLRCDEHVDERLDVLRATRAAARLLGDLKRGLGTWHLAMAAYNAGSGRVRRAIRLGGTRDYWRLARRGLLPRETADYVPQFQAALTIARDPQKYGFEPKSAWRFPKLRRVRVRGAVGLADLATRLGLPYGTLKGFNPNLVRDRTPPDRRGYPVWVPAMPAPPKPAKPESEA
jgi:membrane-bound lytic murein transglycosylase D